MHSSFARKDEQQPLSTNFVCHTWLADGKFIVCTDIGQILLFEQSGDFKQVTIETKFVEIAEADLDELGFQWTFVGKGDSFDQGTTDLDTDLTSDLGFRIFKQVGSGVVESLSSGVRGADAMGFTSASPILKVNSIISDAQFSTVVRALSQRAGTDVLSALGSGAPSG